MVSVKSPELNDTDSVADFTVVWSAIQRIVIHLPRSTNKKEEIVFVMSGELGRSPLGLLNPCCILCFSQELNETCRMMQQRVAEFLSQVADDAVTLTLIQLNDELNSAFQR